MRKLIATAAMLLIFILTGLTAANSFGQAQEQRGKACQIPEPEPSPKPSPSPKPRTPKPQKP